MKLTIFSEMSSTSQRTNLAIHFDNFTSSISRCANCKLNLTRIMRTSQKIIINMDAQLYYSCKLVINIALLLETIKNSMNILSAIKLLTNFKPRWVSPQKLYWSRTIDLQLFNYLKLQETCSKSSVKNNDNKTIHVSLVFTGYKKLLMWNQHKLI